MATLVTQKSHHPFPVQDDVLLVTLAREIAMDIVSLEAILERYKITSNQWTKIQENPRFIELLKSAITEWHSAINTEERIKIKSATLLESWLEEANSRLHDRTESLQAKAELAKFLGRLAHLGLPGAQAGEGAERFSVTINLGADAKLTFQKDIPAKVIDVTPTPQE